MYPYNTMLSIPQRSIVNTTAPCSCAHRGDRVWIQSDRRCPKPVQYMWTTGHWHLALGADDGASSVPQPFPLLVQQLLLLLNLSLDPRQGFQLGFEIFEDLLPVTRQVLGGVEMGATVLADSIASLYDKKYGKSIL